jgi:ligand-binding sensor domain-containing protein
VVLLALVSARAHALDPAKALTQYRIETWGIKDGLPSHTMTAIAQTQEGYLWFASHGGLMRFDGVRFTPFTSRTTPELTSNVVFGCIARQDGSLWIAAQSSGLFSYRDGVLRREPTGWEGDAAARVTLYEAADHSLWATSTGWGLRHLVQGRWTKEPSPDVVRALIDDADGDLWLGTWGQGLHRLHHGELTRVGDEAGGTPAFISSFTRARDGGFWIGARDGLFRYKEGRFTHYTTQDGLSFNDVRALLEDRNGNLWIGTAGGGLNRMSGGSFSHLMRTDGLGDDHALALLEDDEGGVWVGTRAGVVRLRDTSVTISTVQEGLRADAVVQAQTGADGAIWFSTYGGGLHRLDHGRLTVYDTSNGYPDNYLGALHVARDGAVWAGVGTNQLVRVQDGRISVFDTGNRYVKSIGEDDQGLLLGLSRAGLQRLKGGKVVPYLSASGEAIRETFINAIHHARDGTLWVGSSDCLLAIRGGQVTRYPRQIDSIYEDARGTIWLSCRPGLVSFRDGRFTSYGGAAGLDKSLFFGTLEDDEGHLWLNSQDGILRVAKAELEALVAGKGGHVALRVFGPQDGMNAAEYSGPTPLKACRTPDGRMWFPTNHGLAMVDPQHLIADRKLPPVLVETLVMDDRAVQARDGLEVPPGVQKIEIHYTALSYRVPERVQFRYILEGFDDAWVDAGSRRVAYYTKLPPGRFRFRVRAANSDGLWNDTGASVSFQRRPWFHETLWFKALLVALGGLAVLGLHRLRVRRLWLREQELKLRVDQAIAQVKVLSGMLPICASCKKIRDDAGYYVQIETYIRDHSQADFSHGICPECLVKLYPDYERLSRPPGGTTAPR